MDFLGKMPKRLDHTTAKQLGQQAEDRALAYLQAAGLHLLVRNYRTPGRGGGEIDLIVGAPDGTVVFVEVRSRRSAAFGGAAESIGSIKRQRIVLAARHWLQANGACRPCRFDVLLEQGGHWQWLRAAFETD